MKIKFLGFVILVFIHIFFLINIRFTAWPEMFSYPYLFNHGFKIYSDFIHPYPPLLTLIMGSLYKHFGITELTLKSFTWALFVINDVLIFLISKKITKSYFAALGSVAFYIFLQPFLEGNMLWFDTAIVTPILAAIYSSLGINKKNDIYPALVSSFFFTIAILIKQTAVLFVPIFVLYLFSKKSRWKLIGFSVIPPVVLGLGLLARLLREGTLLDFFQWTIFYPLSFWSSFPGYVQMNIKGRDLIITLALVSIPILTLLLNRKKALTTHNIMIFMYFIVSLIAIYPRFSFFHFQTSLAIASILVSLCLENKKYGVFIILGLLIFLYPKIQSPAIFFEWKKETRFMDQSDKLLAQKISNIVEPNEEVFLLGIHSAQYILADRLPPKPWTDNFGWYLEIPGVQESILLRWGQKPKYIFWRQPRSGNWYDLATYQPSKITTWIHENYREIDTIEKDIKVWKRKE